MLEVCENFAVLNMVQNVTTHNVFKRFTGNTSQRNWSVVFGPFKWNKQLSCISLKISKIAGLLHKLKSEYPTSILKSTYNTLILPNINYCILSWGSQINKLYLLQKRAIRNISKSDCRAHTEPLFKEHNLLKVQAIYHMAILKFYSN